MGTEIERKFLVKDGSWRGAVRASAPISQGYIATGPPTAVRVRICGDSANINVKTATLDIRRHEFEFPVPLPEAREMMVNCIQGRVIEKVRHEAEFDGLVWEIDVFEGANAGLVVAELELESEDQPFPRPPWLGDEVSSDPRYLNTSLAMKPFTEW